MGHTNSSNVQYIHMYVRTYVRMYRTRLPWSVCTYMHPYGLTEPTTTLRGSCQPLPPRHAVTGPPHLVTQLYTSSSPKTLWARVLQKVQSLVQTGHLHHSTPLHSWSWRLSLHDTIHIHIVLHPLTVVSTSDTEGGYYNNSHCTTSYTPLHTWLWACWWLILF